MHHQAPLFRRRFLASLLALGALAPTPAMAVSPSVPVRIGGDVVLPACSRQAELKSESSTQTGVDILSGPTRSFRAIDRLPVGTVVLSCDENGTYIGVIYGEGDCGVGQTLPRRTAYRGTCSSGWVHNREIVAVEAPNV